LNDDDQLKLLFDTLVRHYDLVMTRRATLSGQASSLLTFAGIIQTILVGFLTTLATSIVAQTALSANPNHQIIFYAIDAGFAMYLLTAIMAICAYIETKWTPAPVPIDGTTPDEWRTRIDEIHANSKTLSRVGLEMQLVTAINRHQATNNRKYILLILGYTFLVAGIALTALAGFMVMGGIVLKPATS
jgi:hypothetical protein